MASAIVDNWTEMNCIRLIREFRSRPILWDQKDPFYYKKCMKPQIWEEIGKKLDMPALECKHKMNILMSSFRREKAKIMHKIEGKNRDSSSTCVSTWFAFKEMMFLMDKETERKKIQKGSDNLDGEIDDDEDSSSLKRTLLKHHIQPPISNNKRPRFTVLREVTKQSISIPTDINDTPDRSQATNTPPVPITSSEADDEIKSFANFISFKMKKYSETTKNAVQQAICDIVFKADQNYYENSENFVILDERDVFANNIEIEENIKGEHRLDCYVDDDSE